VRLHEDTIEAVKERADIYEIVSEAVVLKKQGRNFVGLCPFHEERTPSFSVSPAKQMFYCFGCGKGGNAITFLREFGQQSFTEVVLDLARRYNVPIKTLEPEQQREFQKQLSRRERLHEIMAVATNFYQHALGQPQGRVAWHYLTEQRRLTPETIESFQLGYAPAGWDTLLGYLTGKGFAVELIEQVGLIIPRKQGDGYYDRFRDRLMIPICDDRGRVVAFGGRTLGDEQPKYLNSPETELFEKGRMLFAIDRAKAAIAKEDRAVVVEGYFDAIALHAAGIATVVASLGTALSEAQVRQLLRYTDSKQVVFNFDADAAGIKATNRAIGEVADLAYRGAVQLRILNLPAGKDADEFLLATSAAAYRQLLDTAPLWLDWQIDRLLETNDISQADGYQRVMTEVVALLQRIHHPTTRSHYINRCAEALGAGDVRRVPLVAETLITQVMTQVRRSRLPPSQSDYPSGKLFGHSSGHPGGGASGKGAIRPHDRALATAADSSIVTEPSLQSGVEWFTGSRPELTDSDREPDFAPSAEALTESNPETEVRATSSSLVTVRDRLTLIRGLQGDRRLLFEAEETLLRVYLHCPELRTPAIAAIQHLEQQDIFLSFSHHRQLWQVLLQCYAHNPQLNILVWLQDYYAEHPQWLAQINPLIYLDETTVQDIQRPALMLRSALAAIELTVRYQRYRQLLHHWRDLDLIHQATEAQQFQVQLYQEKARIDYLELLRHTDITDLVHATWGGTQGDR